MRTIGKVMSRTHIMDVPTASSMPLVLAQLRTSPFPLRWSTNMAGSSLFA